MNVARVDATEGAIVLDDIRLASAISAYAWLVPGVVLGLPGLLVLIIVGLQIVAASLFVPLTRRMLGDRRSGRRPDDPFRSLDPSAGVGSLAIRR